MTDTDAIDAATRDGQIWANLPESARNAYREMAATEPDGTRYVGEYLGAMGDPTTGPVYVDPTTTTTTDGVHRSRVTSHTCPCGGDLWWDDGTGLDLPEPAPGGTCPECGHAFNTTTEMPA